eukprot:m.239959 g.239959  ORF g.239959 m.239959 type:complete len:60 (-) comp17126_c3_seq2:76-255(-)
MCWSEHNSHPLNLFYLHWHYAMRLSSSAVPNQVSQMFGNFDMPCTFFFFSRDFLRHSSL